MKLHYGTSTAISIATLLHMSSAQTEPCVVGGFTLEVTGGCTTEKMYGAYEHLYNSTECGHTVAVDFRLILNLASDATDAEVDAAVRGICEIAWVNAHKVPFDMTHRQGDQFAQMYYDGGTNWNEEVETYLETGERTNHLRTDAAVVNEFYKSFGRSAQVEWPDLPQFDLDTCHVNAAMCCWPQDRQANDGNGNCATPYDTNCYDKDPADNTDLCLVDLTRSLQGNKFGQTGHVVYPGDNGSGEGAIHCHGFAWANDEYDSISRFKANNLFYVSMYDHLHQRGYVRNVPGSPMCGCLEQMPTVTRSDCTQIDVVESYKFIYDPEADSFSAELTSSYIDFNACQGRYNRNNDLHAYVARLVQEGRVSPDQRAGVDKYIVGNHQCHYAADYEMGTKGYVTGYYHDEDTWMKVAGSDSLHIDDIGDEGFRALFAESPQPIVKRVCISCTRTHQEIYYKRLTPVPDTLNLLETLLNNWVNFENVQETDFLIYSTYEDAVAGVNPWTFYSFRGDYGFPYESGPTARTHNQWRRFKYGQGRSDVAFYIMKSDTSTLRLMDGSDDLVGVDINNPVVKGTTIKQDGTYYVTGGGYDIWNNADQFYYLKDTSHIEADMVVKTYLSSFVHRDYWSKAGIMVRDSESPGAKNFMCAMSARGVYAQRRTVTDSWSSAEGGSSVEIAFVPTWLMLTKTMNSYTCSKSTDGVTWEQVGNTRVVEMDTETAHVGMAVTSHQSWLLSPAEAVFEDYEVQTSFYPSLAPTVSRSPTYKYFTDGVVLLDNVYSSRRLYGQGGKTAESGIGAFVPTGHVYADNVWQIEPVDCAIEKDCYTFKNTHSLRCLYAETGKDWQAGVGANLCSDGVTEISKWYLEESCDGACFFIINAANNRRLYAQQDQSWENGVGAVPGHHCDDQKWKITIYDA